MIEDVFLVLCCCSLRRRQRPRESSVLVGETGRVIDQTREHFVLGMEPESSRGGSRKCSRSVTTAQESVGNI